MDTKYNYKIKKRLTIMNNIQIDFGAAYILEYPFTDQLVAGTPPQDFFFLCIWLGHILKIWNSLS